MNRRRFVALAALAVAAPLARAHHGWSSFDQNRPLYLRGTAKAVKWRSPHVELDLELAPDLALPADLAERRLPPQRAPVDGKGLLARAALPARKDRVWHLELAPLTRMQAWGIAPIREGETIEVLGFTFAGEEGEAVLRVEYLFRDGRAYGLRSSPA